MKKPTSMQRVPTRLRPPGPESPADLVRARTEAMNAHSAPRAWPEWVLPCVREVPTTSGVYAVFDRDTGTYYYGSTRHLRSRWIAHRKAIGTTHWPTVSNAPAGLKGRFSFVVIAECPLPAARLLERALIRASAHAGVKLKNKAHTSVRPLSPRGPDRRERLLTHNGETMPVKAWLQRLGISRRSLNDRSKEWGVHEVLSRPRKSCQ
jgi:hypothetical protein